jgi:fibronectin type 3 domain-containing protein
MVSGTQQEGQQTGLLSAVPVNAAVAGLKVAGTSYNGVSVTWTKSAGASGYDIYRSASAASGFKLVKTNAGANAVSMTDTGLSTGKTYYYKVVPYRSMSGGKAVGGEAVASGAPVNAAVKDLAAKGQDISGIKLTWSKSAGASGYYVYRSVTKSGGYQNVRTITTNKAANTYTDTGLEPGTKYYYKVIPYRSMSGGKVKGRTAGPVAGQTKSDTPTGVQVVASGARQLTVSWNKVSGAYAYEVRRATSLNGTYKGIKSTRGLSYIDTGLGANATYYYKIRAYRLVNGGKVYSALSGAVSALTRGEKPSFNAGVSPSTNNNATSIGFSITNTGAKDMTVLAGGAVLEDATNSSYNRVLTIWDGTVRVTESVTIKPGERKVFTMSCSPATRYNPDSHIIVRFLYDGSRYKCDASYNAKVFWSPDP